MVLFGVTRSSYESFNSPVFVCRFLCVCAVETCGCGWWPSTSAFTKVHMSVLSVWGLFYVPQFIGFKCHCQITAHWLIIWEDARWSEDGLIGVCVHVCEWQMGLRIAANILRVSASWGTIHPLLTHTHTHTHTHSERVLQCFGVLYISRDQKWIQKDHPVHP